MRKDDQTLMVLDTNILIWGVLKPDKTPEEKEMTAKATAFLDKVCADKQPLAISMITVGEFLVCVPPEKREEYANQLQKSFVILQYDLLAAMRSADICGTMFGKMKNSYRGCRAILRQDIQILGSAMAHGNVSAIVTEDGGFQALARHYLNVIGLPDNVPEQLELFDSK